MGQGDDEPQSLARHAATAIAEATGVARHDVAIVLGSGWAAAADALGPHRVEIDADSIPGFPSPKAQGHPGRIRSVNIDGVATLAFLGRTHLYEGHGVDTVVHAVRTAAATGCRTVILTNGAGSLNPEWTPGTPVLIRDHLNLFGITPLHGPTFLDMTDLYSARLRSIARTIDSTLADGVYAQFLGPQYETPAEIAMVRTLGGNLVGMSTVQEAIAAREAGMEVLGISLVTNLAAGMTGVPLDHDEVLTTGTSASERVGVLLQGVVSRLP